MLSFSRLRDQVIVCRIEIVCRWSWDVNPPVYNPHHSDFNPTHTPGWDWDIKVRNLCEQEGEVVAVVLLTVEVVLVVELVEVQVEVHISRKKGGEWRKSELGSQSWSHSKGTVVLIPATTNLPWNMYFPKKSWSKILPRFIKSNVRCKIKQNSQMTKSNKTDPNSTWQIETHLAG